MDPESNERAIVALARKINLIRDRSLPEYDVTYPDPESEFKRLEIPAPADLLQLYREIVCCKDSNHEGRTTRFVPIEEMAGFEGGFIPFYDQLNFCWTIYARSDDGISSKVYCEYEISANNFGKMEMDASMEAFLSKVAAGEDIFSSVNGLISKKYPRIKL